MYNAYHGKNDLLCNGFPARSQSTILNLFAVGERNKQTRFFVPSCTKLLQDFVAFGYISLSVSVDKHHSTIVVAKVTNMFSSSAVKAVGIDNRIIAILKIEVLYLDTSRRHLKTIPKCLIADSANVMFMVKVILFFIISFMLSLTLNVALAAVLYKNWVDKQLHK